MQAKEASNVEPYTLGQSVMGGPERTATSRGAQGKGAQSGICQCCTVSDYLVASHDVARLLAGG